MSVYFGPRWDSPAFEGCVQVPVPVGKPCLYCGVAIAEDDRGTLTGYLHSDGEFGSSATHLGCHLRSVLGNVTHLSGGCRYIGDCTEAEDATPYEQGRAVLEFLEANPDWPHLPRPVAVS